MRKIPILIGGSGEKRTLPAVARHADIWHTFLPIDQFNRASKLVGELATANGRNDSDIERSSVWETPGDADAYRGAGVTLFTTEIHPTEAGYDFSTLEKMVAWRDAVSDVSETTVPIRRVTVKSERPFDDVVAAVYAGLGMVEHFDGLVRRWSAATDREEFDAVIEPVAGSSGLIEFLSLRPRRACSRFETPTAAAGCSGSSRATPSR